MFYNKDNSLNKGELVSQIKNRVRVLTKIKGHKFSNLENDLINNTIDNGTTKSLFEIDELLFEIYSNYLPNEGTYVHGHRVHTVKY